MAKIKGTVTKAGKSKFSYFIQLDGNDYYYNTKFKPKCGEGDVVGVEFMDKGGTRGQINKLVVLTDNSGGYDKSNSERGGGFGGGDGGGSPRGGAGTGGQRNESITWQSCQKVSAQLVQTLVQAGAVASKGNPESKRAEIEGAFDELTTKLFEAALNPKASEAYKATKQVEAEAGGGDAWDEGDTEAGGDTWGEDEAW